MGQSVGKTVHFHGQEFTILRSIGEGGFAEIFLVRAEKEKRLRALKRMVAARDDREKHRIAKWEFQLNQRFMKHPNIVACEGAQVINHPNGDVEYLILLEYCEHGTLLDWIKSPQHASKTNMDVLTIFRQLIDAVAVFHAHQPPIRHSDIKAENVLFATDDKSTAASAGAPTPTPGPLVKLCDFGSSSTDVYLPKTAEQRVTIGGLLEKTTTPSYRAPEMCDLYSGKLINHQADVWACGVVLYTMLFREQPFPDGNLAILSGKYHVPEQHRWSPKLMEILARCLTIDPAKRINVVQLQMALAELAKVRPKLVDSWTMFKAAAAAAGAGTNPTTPTAGGSTTSTTSSTSSSSAQAKHSSASSSPSTTPSSSSRALVGAAALAAMTPGAGSGPTIPPRPTRPLPPRPAATAAAADGAQQQSSASRSSPRVMLHVTSPSSAAFADGGDDDDFNPSFPDPTPSPLPPTTPQQQQASPAPPAQQTPTAAAAAATANRPQVQIRPPAVAAAAGTAAMHGAVNLKTPTSTSGGGGGASTAVVPPRITGPTALPSHSHTHTVAGAPTSSVSIGPIKLPKATGAGTAAATTAAAVEEAAKKEKKEKKLKKDADAAAGGGGGGDEASGDEEDDDPERTLVKLVKRCTRDDSTPAKVKHLLKLVQASWQHRGEVSTVQAQQTQQHGTCMPAEDLARHMLAWCGLPTVFAHLAKRPVHTKANVAWKSLLLVHRLLQAGAPPILGQVYVNRRFLEEVEAHWAPDAAAAASAGAGAGAGGSLSSFISPYAKHLLHRLAFHQLHPHYEGGLALGHYIWSLARGKDWPRGWTLQAKMARDDVHHLLQLMAEALRLGQAVLDTNGAGSATPAGASDPSDEAAAAAAAVHFRHQLLVPLLDDLYAMFLACTFMLAQLCLVLGIRPLAAAPPGLPRGLVTKKMIDASHAAAVAAAASPGGHAPSPSASSFAQLASTLQPIPLDSPAALQVDPHPDNVEVPLDTPPANPEEDQVLKSVPTLLSAHRTILERLHALFGAAQASSVVREARHVYILPPALAAFQAVPLEYFPTPSTIPLTAGENATLCARFQQVNEEEGRKRHRSLGAKGTFLHQLPPPITKEMPTPPQQQQASRPQPPPPAPSAPAPSAAASSAGDVADDGSSVEETPEERARRKEAKRLKREAKAAKKASKYQTMATGSGGGGGTAEHSADEGEGGGGGARARVAMGVTASSATSSPTLTSTKANARSFSSLAPPPPPTEIDPFSTPASPFSSPDELNFAAASPTSSNSGGKLTVGTSSDHEDDDPSLSGGGNSSVGGGSLVDDPFASAGQQEVHGFDDVDPFASFAQATRPQPQAPQAKTPAASASTQPQPPPPTPSPIAAATATTSKAAAATPKGLAASVALTPTALPPSSVTIAPIAAAAHTPAPSATPPSVPAYPAALAAASPTAPSAAAAAPLPAALPARSTPNVHRTPFSPSPGEFEVDSTPFDSSSAAGDLQGNEDDDDDEEDDDDGSSSMLSSGVSKGQGHTQQPRKVRTEADYLPADYVRPTAAAPSATSQGKKSSQQKSANGSTVTSPFEEGGASSSSEDDDEDESAHAWGQHTDDSPAPAAVVPPVRDISPFADDPFSDISPSPTNARASLSMQPKPLTSDVGATPFDDHHALKSTPVGAPVAVANGVASLGISSSTKAATTGPTSTTHARASSSSASSSSASAAAAPTTTVMLSPFDDPKSSPPPPAPVAPVAKSTAAVAAAAANFSPFDDEPHASSNDSGNPFDEEGELELPRNGPGAVLGKSALGKATAAASSSAGASASGSSSSSSASSAAPVADLLPDEIDASELTFDERIGVGAFAEVYAGSWRGCDVAIKKLFAKSFQSPEAVDEFRREIQLLRTLRSPHILLFMAACPQPESMCIVTELMATSLFDLLHNSDVPIPWRLTLQIACDAARGILYLHSAKPPIIHRDLKSPNILLDSGRRAKICDFGLAQTKSKGGAQGAAGTFAYMAPEIIAGGEYHEPADVYSFGIILNEIVSRQVPYEGMNAAQISVAVLNKGIRPSLPAHCPSQYSALLQACWDQDPENRPPFSFIVEKLNAQLAEAKKKPADYRPV